MGASSTTDLSRYNPNGSLIVLPSSPAVELSNGCNVPSVRSGALSGYNPSGSYTSLSVGATASLLTVGDKNNGADDCDKTIWRLFLVAVNADTADDCSASVAQVIISFIIVVIFVDISTSTDTM